MRYLHSSTADPRTPLSGAEEPCEAPQRPQHARLCLQGKQRSGQDMKGLFWHLRSGSMKKRRGKKKLAQAMH